MLETLGKKERHPSMKARRRNRQGIGKAIGKNATDYQTETGGVLTEMQRAREARAEKLHLIGEHIMVRQIQKLVLVGHERHSQ